MNQPKRMIGMNNSPQTNDLDLFHETRNSISQPFPPQTEIVHSPPAQNLRRVDRETTHPWHAAYPV